MQGLLLGRVCHLVQIAISQKKLLGYDCRSESLVPHIHAMELRSFSKFPGHFATDALRETDAVQPQKICDSSDLLNVIDEDGGETFVDVHDPKDAYTRDTLAAGLCFL